MASRKKLSASTHARRSSEALHDGMAAYLIGKERADVVHVAPALALEQIQDPSAEVRGQCEEGSVKLVGLHMCRHSHI